MQRFLTKLGKTHQIRYWSVVLDHSDAFLRIVLSKASFISPATTPCSSEKFTALVINGNSRSKQPIKTDAGIGSRAQDLRPEDQIIISSDNSFVVTNLNSQNVEPW